MTTAVLIALAAAAVRLIFIYYHPFGPCRRCTGSGLNRLSTKKRMGPCKRCGGGKLTQRRGSRALHRLIRGTSDAVKTTRKRK